jgi:hypothetical protein
MKKGNILLFALAFGSFLNAPTALDRILKQLKGEKQLKGKKIVFCGCKLKVETKGPKGQASYVKFTEPGIRTFLAKTADARRSQAQRRGENSPQRTLKDILAAEKEHPCSEKKGRKKRTGRI